MYFIAEFEFKALFYQRERRTVMIEADSKEQAEEKLYAHFDVPLSRWTGSDYQTIVVGDTDNDIDDLQITECIR